MGIVLLVAGSTSVLVGVVRLLRTFRGGLHDRDVARTDAAQNLVQPALLVTFGFFLAFVGLANIIAAQYTAS